MNLSIYHVMFWKIFNVQFDVQMNSHELRLMKLNVIF